MMPEKLTRMYKSTLNVHWKYEWHEGTFYHIWWTYKKATKNLWIHPPTLRQRILTINNQLNLELFLLGLIDTQLDKSRGRLFQNIINEVRLLYSER